MTEFTKFWAGATMDTFDEIKIIAEAISKLADAACELGPSYYTDSKKASTRPPEFLAAAITCAKAAQFLAEGLMPKPEAT